MGAAFLFVRAQASQAVCSLNRINWHKCLAAAPLLISCQMEPYKRPGEGKEALLLQLFSV